MRSVIAFSFHISNSSWLDFQLDIFPQKWEGGIFLMGLRSYYFSSFFIFFILFPQLGIRMILKFMIAPMHHTAGGILSEKFVLLDYSVKVEMEHLFLFESKGHILSSTTLLAEIISESIILSLHEKFPQKVSSKSFQKGSLKRFYGVSTKSLLKVSSKSRLSKSFHEKNCIKSFRKQFPRKISMKSLHKISEEITQNVS